MTEAVASQPWYGKLPEHWPAQPLKALFRVVGGSTPKSDNENYWDGDIIWVTPSDLQDNSIASLRGSQRTITDLGLASCGTTLVPVSSIVLSTRAPIGSLGIAEVPLCTNQGCKSLVPRPAVSSAFYAYLLSVTTTELRVRGKGTTFLELSSDELSAFRVPVPPLSEQTAIAAFLDHETGKIDALVEEQKRLIELLKEKRQAVISQAVTKGMDLNVRMRPSGVEWLGDVPEHWELKRFKDVCLEIVDCKNRTPEKVDESSYFVVRTTCIRDGQFNSQGGYWTDAASFDEWTKKGRPQSGDILFTREAPAGEAALCPDNLALCLGQRMMYLRPNPTTLMPDFLLATIYGPLVRSQVDAKSKGSTVGHLRVGEIGELPCLLPSLHEQKAIVEALRKAEADFRLLNRTCMDSVSLLQERRSALISAAVTGKIDVREITTQEEAA